MSDDLKWLLGSPERKGELIHGLKKVAEEYITLLTRLRDVVDALDLEATCAHDWKSIDYLKVAENMEWAPPGEGEEPRVAGTTWHYYSRCSACGKLRAEEVVYNEAGDIIFRQDIDEVYLPRTPDRAEK